MSVIDDLQTLGLIRTQPSFGGIIAQVVVEENHLDQMEITSHPVEQGASITDHAFMRPAELTLRMGWANLALPSLQSLFDDAINATAPSIPQSNWSLYQQILSLQASRQLISIVTAKRSYQNMLISSVATVTDKRTANILMITAQCRQVILVETLATTLPPASAQANPELTAPVTPVGRQQLAPAPNFNTQGYNAGVGKQ